MPSASSLRCAIDHISGPANTVIVMWEREATLSYPLGAVPHVPLRPCMINITCEDWLNHDLGRLSSSDPREADYPTDKHIDGDDEGQAGSARVRRTGNPHPTRIQSFLGFNRASPDFVHPLRVSTLHLQQFNTSIPPVHFPRNYGKICAVKGD